MALCPVQHLRIRPRRIIMHIIRMPHLRQRHYRHPRAATIRFHSLTIRPHDPRTAPSAEDTVVFHFNVQHRTSEIRRCSGKARASEELPRCEGRFRGFDVARDGGVEEGVCEEGVLEVPDIRPREIAVRVL